MKLGQGLTCAEMVITMGSTGVMQVTRTIVNTTDVVEAYHNIE